MPIVLFVLFAFFLFFLFNLVGCFTISLGTRISITSKSHCIPAQQLLLQRGKLLNCWWKNVRENCFSLCCSCSIGCRVIKEMLGWPYLTLWLSLHPFIYSHQKHFWNVFKFIWVNYKWMEYFCNHTNLSLIY